ncbi:MAG: divergent polysaccharide deacetylase family protein [Acetobacteraceae bacterium]|nr:divergent polysaccharide deacetylase family protein [Acetobacteraceae bacterium]
MADRNGRRNPRERAGWRWLGVFWLTVLSLMAAGGGVLEWLGPPGAVVAKPQASARGGVTQTPATQDARTVVVVARAVLVPRVVSGRDTPGPVADPDPALLEPVSGGATGQLPRIASDGRTAMQVYAAGFDYSSRRPRVGLLLAGIGMNEAESHAAIRALPGGISLAVSPYAANVSRLLATARASGHEYLIALPLEPAGFPLNDPGPATLLTSASLAVNAQNLHWALSRIQGYAGAAGVIGTMRGERFAAMSDQMDAVLSELAGRGLIYVDPREEWGPVAKTWGRHAELVIDDPASREAIDAKLAELEQLAKDHGSALGLVMRPTPVAVARIAAWTNGLADRGLALAPVSALAVAPAGPPVKLSERDK